MEVTITVTGVHGDANDEVLELIRQLLEKTKSNGGYTLHSYTRNSFSVQPKVPKENQ